MKKPRLLDLYCGAGGCSVGYARAGFDVVGVDLLPQPNYPFKFCQADALTFPLDGFDFLHASPECDGYSVATLFHGHATRDEHPLHISTIRQRFIQSGKPYIIENVVSAMRHMHQPITMCGITFGLDAPRHRLFESNVKLIAPKHQRHIKKVAKPGAIPLDTQYWCIGGHFGQKERAALEGLGIDWMTTQKEIGNAIPPAYTEWIGRQLLNSTALCQRLLF